MLRTRQRVLTGIQPTNRLHIGNYIGCIQQIQELNPETNEIFVLIADLHGLTGNTTMSDSIDNLMRVCLATCGENVHYYIQSQHLETTYIAWFLSCCTPIGQLQRMTQFKSKSKEDDGANSGLLFYPILMTADILQFDAHIIPVGVDQQQHIELARDTCGYFANKFGKDIFVKPQGKICESIKIKSLQDPSKKMSKSDESTIATIFLDDLDHDVQTKIQKAVTDPEKIPTDIAAIEETRPGIYNLCQIYKSFADCSFKDIENQFGGGNTSVFKNALTELLVEKISKIRHQVNQISQEQANQIISRDFNLVHGILNKKVKEINDLCGLNRFAH